MSLQSTSGHRDLQSHHRDIGRAINDVVFESHLSVPRASLTAADQRLFSIA